MQEMAVRLDRLVGPPAIGGGVLPEFGGTCQDLIDPLTWRLRFCPGLGSPLSRLSTVIATHL